MRLLSAISIACFCAVLAITLAVARRIRASRARGERRLQGAGASEVFEAGEFRTPRSLPLNQDLRPPGSRRALTEFMAARPGVEARFSRGNDLGLRDHAGEMPSAAMSQSLAPMLPKLQLVTPQVLVPRSQSTVDALDGQRKTPQSSRSSVLRRIDLSHFNDDLGDLTDPYTHSLRSSGTHDRNPRNG